MDKFIIKIIVLYTLIKLSTAANTSITYPFTPNSIVQQSLYETFQRTSFLYGLSTISDEHLIESRCHAHLQLFQRAVMSKQPWALKMFDASASMEPGFTFGNNFWLGNREVCSAVGKPLNVQMSAHLPRKMNAHLLTSVAPFPIDFRVVYLRHNSSWQVDIVLLGFAPRVHIGLCLPSSCSELDVQHLMQTYLSTDLPIGNELYDMHLEYDYAKDFKVEAATFKRTSFYLCCVFVLASLGLTLAALMFRESEKTETLTEKPTEAPVRTEDISTQSLSNSETVLQQQQQLREPGFLACFDIQENWRILFTTGKKDNVTFALNGARFACALCVTYYHYVMCSFMATRNKLFLYNYQVAAGNLDLFVDIFYTISGFLHANSHFRNVKLLEMIRKNNFTQNLKLIGMHLFHRYLRLAPMYFLVLGITAFLSKLYDDTTLFHMEYKAHVNCEKYWWRNVFFIQNFFNCNDMCAIWTWSLASDMQFYTLAIALFFVYVKHPRRTKLCIAALVIANIVYTYFYGLKLNIDISLESTYAYFTEIYINSLSRIFGYISGVIAGWLVVQQWRPSIAFSKNVQQYFGYLLVFVFIGCLLKPPINNLNALAASTVLVLDRTIFAVTAGIIFIFNAYGHLRWFFGIFETALFQKFNKVAYAMSLLNPILISTLTSLSRSSMYANLLNMVFEYIGIVVILVLISIFFTLLYDIPFRNLSRLLINKQFKKKLS